MTIHNIKLKILPICALATVGVYDAYSMRGAPYTPPLYPHHDGATRTTITQSVEQVNSYNSPVFLSTGLSSSDIQQLQGTVTWLLGENQILRRQLLDSQKQFAAQQLELTQRLAEAEAKITGLEEKLKSHNAAIVEVAKRENAHHEASLRFADVITDRADWMQAILHKTNPTDCPPPQEKNNQKIRQQEQTNARNYRRKIQNFEDLGEWPSASKSQLIRQQNVCGSDAPTKSSSSSDTTKSQQPLPRPKAGYSSSSSTSSTKKNASGKSFRPDTSAPLTPPSQQDARSKSLKQDSSELLAILQPDWQKAQKQ